MGEHPGQLRLLIATDNHLGVWEDDEIRKHDSFVAFEEILQHAHRLRVDALLLGGDLFHENKPSRPTVVRTIQLLRKYVMNDNPVQIQVLSDQAANFSLNTRVNYEDENYNVGLPIFIIHGNHDEPAGADNLSAIDILAACNLVNYFGKTGMSGAGAGRCKVDIAPVLLQKDDTRLALYGLGYMRDSRLYRMMTTAGEVTWRRPADAPGAPADSWFNLFFIHQNHAQRGTKNAVSEKQLPKWLDLVVWGHEHASKTEPTPSTENPFDVSQPGSSVQTTLSEDEARPKRILLLTLKGSDFRTETLPLRSVRPFVFENLVLRDEPSLAARPDDVEAISRYLHDAVEAAIARALQQASTADGGAATGAGPGALLSHGAEATGAAPAAAVSAALPLVRLRVDHSGGYSTVPLQRFGAAFQGRVANPWDLLQFHKAAAKRVKPERGGAGAATVPADGVGDADGAEPEGSEHRRIDALVSAHLPATLQILAEVDMALALEEFVQRDEKGALEKAVRTALAESQKKVAARGVPEVDDPAEMLRAINCVVQEIKAGKAARADGGGRGGDPGPTSAAAAAQPAAAWQGEDVDMVADGDAGDGGAAAVARGRAKPAAAKPRAKPVATKAKPKQATVTGLFGRAAQADADDDADEQPVARRAPSRRAAAAPKQTYAEGDSEEGAEDDGDDDFGAGQALRRGAARGGAAGGADETNESEDDADLEEEAAEDGALAPKRKAAAPRGGRGKGKAAAPSTKRGRAAADTPLHDSSDDEGAPGAKAARVAARAPQASLPPSAPSQQTGATQGTRGGWGSMRRA